jgi:hypothetical protein
MPTIVNKIELEWIAFHQDRLTAYISGSNKLANVKSTIDIFNPELLKKFDKKFKQTTKSKPREGTLKYLVSNRQAINGECFMWTDTKTGNEVIHHSLCLTDSFAEIVKEIKGILVTELSKLK